MSREYSFRGSLREFVQLLVRHLPRHEAEQLTRALHDKREKESMKEALMTEIANSTQITGFCSYESALIKLTREYDRNAVFRDSVNNVIDTCFDGLFPTQTDIELDCIVGE